ncbi:hypothetical protein NI382_00760 [Vibrio parahaemolyticus]|nr:hypothetical protein NI382_00760 [Vibrio parahaemolyticus]
MFNRILLHVSILVALLFSPLSIAEQEPEVDLGRAEDLMHCSIMTKQLKWTGYLPMSFAFEAYKPCKHLKDITQRNQCSNPIRSSLTKPKESNALHKLTWTIALACSEMKWKPKRSDKNSMNNNGFTMKKWLNSNSSATTQSSNSQ